MALLRNARLALVAYGALGVLVGVAAPTTARAQDAYVVPDELRRRPELPEGLDASGARALTLSEAIQIAVQQNLGVVLSREQYASTDD